MTISGHRQCSTLDEAKDLLVDIVQRQDGGDANCLNSQLNRYLYSIERISQLYQFRAGSLILAVTTCINPCC